MKALIIGESKHVFISEIESFFETGSTNNISAQESIDGGAPIMASLLSKYGIDSYVGSVVGDDTFGLNIKKELENYRVHTEYMETAYGKRTTITNVYITKKDRSITKINISKEPLLLRKSEFAFTPDIIVTDGYDYGTTVAALNRFQNAIGIMKCTIYSKEILELCKYCNYIIMSNEFAESISGSSIDFENPNSLITVLSSIINKFPGKEIVICINERGALYTVNSQIKVMPGIKVETVDDTSSGYYFTAAFAYAISSKYDIEKAITFANIVAGLSVKNKGLSSRLPELATVMEYFKQKYPDVTPQGTETTETVTNTETETL